jgi:uncharacterized cupin superfamily protein
MSRDFKDCGTAAEFEMEPFSVHEFVQVLEGAATITERTGPHIMLEAGDCFHPKGTRWLSGRVPTYIQKYYAQIIAL